MKTCVFHRFLWSDWLWLAVAVAGPWLAVAVAVAAAGVQWPLRSVKSCKNLCIFVFWRRNR